ncbi:hypothetical protein CMEL01_13903 [Colletotrichum melonis]|uniref:Uncharacterized protein n=1 Tax=Colletotrichum melonis TaxID=1209925 RepID=A0AAI9UTT7_9PEZI|nr:hypothetical protein CMEL01_13903 [Colletotrichum melonis]
MLSANATTMTSCKWQRPRVRRSMSIHRIGQRTQPPGRALNRTASTCASARCSPIPQRTAPASGSSQPSARPLAP